jgi:hypothetical protein
VKYIFRRQVPQGNHRDVLNFDSSPFTAIPAMYGYESIRLQELEEDATPTRKWFYVFAKNSSGKEIRFGVLEMLTAEGIRQVLRHYEY